MPIRSEPTPIDCTAYLAAPGYVEPLREELGEVVAEYDRLLVVEGPERPVAWAANVWRRPQYIEVESIGKGAKALRAIQRNWVQFPLAEHRRAALLEEKLPSVSMKPLVFGDAAPSAPLGSWCLLDKHTMLAAADCSSPFAHGEARFVEDREVPPNRAYLKLWEALTLLDEVPGPGQTCLDLGSSPGGWTWVLQQLGSSVISVDKAPLDPAIASLNRVDTRQESAFGLEPVALGKVDWLFCDIACYPQRLLEMIRRWLESGRCKRFVCTLKFQGDTDHAVARQFASIEGSQLRHLSQNKHELTWSLL